METGDGESRGGQHGFYARPAAHLPSLATRVGGGTLNLVQASLASFWGGVVKTFRRRTFCPPEQLRCRPSGPVIRLSFRLLLRPFSMDFGGFPVETLGFWSFTRRSPVYTIVSTHVVTHVSTEGLAMTKLKIRNVGNSLGVVLPKELIARLRVSKGDQLFVQETVDGLRLTAYDPEFEKQMEIAKMVMQEDRDALRALSK